MSCEHEHYTHGHSHGDGDDHIPPTATNSVQNLREYIDFYGLRALNCQQRQDELQYLFKSPEDKFSLETFIESDSDAQLILQVPFTGNVKLYSIIIRSNGASEHCPKRIKLFKNDKTLDFDNILDMKPTFQFDQPLIGPHQGDVDTEEESFVEHHLPRSQFQSTHHLTLFIQDNWDEDEDETTKLYYIELRGVFTSPLSKNPVIALYESAANPADHKNILQQEVGNHADIN